MAKIRLLVGSIILAFFTSGCVYLGLFAAGAVAGIAGYKYKNGVLTVIYEAPYMATWDASLKALQEMGLKIEKSEHDLTTGEISALRNDGKTVTLKIEYLTAKTTQVDIRVGTFGDEEASKVIKEKIRTVLIRS